MDFGLVALVLLVGGKVLDYVAPRTKNKVDDRIRSIFHKAEELLPLAETVSKATASKPSEAPKQVEGFKADGGVRDHRNK